MVVFPNGYIVKILGPYSENMNDITIINKLLRSKSLALNLGTFLLLIEAFEISIDLIIKKSKYHHFLISFGNNLISEQITTCQQMQICFKNYQWQNKKITLSISINVLKIVYYQLCLLISELRVQYTIQHSNL